MSTRRLYWLSMPPVILSCGLHFSGLWFIRRIGQEFAAGTQMLEVSVAVLAIFSIGGNAFIMQRHLWRVGLAMNLTSAYLLLILLVAVFVFQWLMLAIRI